MLEVINCLLNLRLHRVENVKPLTGCLDRAVVVAKIRCDLLLFKRCSDLTEVNLDDFVIPLGFVATAINRQINTSMIQSTINMMPPLLTPLGNQLALVP